jgi:hypothetical protein
MMSGSLDDFEGIAVAVGGDAEFASQRRRQVIPGFP